MVWISLWLEVLDFILMMREIKLRRFKKCVHKGFEATRTSVTAPGLGELPPQLCHGLLRGFGSQWVGSKEPPWGILTKNTGSRGHGDMTREEHEPTYFCVKVAHPDVPEIKK